MLLCGFECSLSLTLLRAFTLKVPGKSCLISVECLFSMTLVPGWSGNQTMSIYSSLAKISREEGVRALWKGNGVTVLHRLPYSSVNFYVYEQLMDLMEGEAGG